jgi:hypothetical protein
MSAQLTPFRVEVGFWLLLCGSLAIGIGYETDWGQRWRWPMAETVLPPSEFTKPVLAEPFHLPPPDTFLETTLRPIFLVTRRPAPIPPPPEPPRPSMKKDQFVLTGTTIVPEGRFAFLLERAANRVRVVGEGKDIGGILVKEVGDSRVVLTQYDEEEVLVLKPTKPPAPPPASVNVPVAPSSATSPGTPAPPGGRRAFRDNGSGQAPLSNSVPQP